MDNSTKKFFTESLIEGFILFFLFMVYLVCVGNKERNGVDITDTKDFWIILMMFFPALCVRYLGKLRGYTKNIWKFSLIFSGSVVFTLRIITFNGCISYQGFLLLFLMMEIFWFIIRYIQLHHDEIFKNK